jgi:hypothetical protein
MRYLFDKQRVGDCSNRRKDGLGKNKKIKIKKRQLISLREIKS